MSLMTAAFGFLLDAQEAAQGTRPTLTIGGVTVDIVIGQAAVDPMIYDGGIADKDAPSVQSRLADWTSGVPEKNDSATIASSTGSNGTYDVMSTVERNGILEIRLGSRAAA